MNDRDAVEFTAAFVLGALVGAGVTLLLTTSNEAETAPREIVLQEPEGSRVSLESPARRAATGLRDEVVTLVRDEAAHLLREAGTGLVKGLVARWAASARKPSAGEAD